MCLNTSLGSCMSAGLSFDERQKATWTQNQWLNSHNEPPEKKSIQPLCHQQHPPCRTVEVRRHGHCNVMAMTRHSAHCGVGLYTPFTELQAKHSTGSPRSELPSAFGKRQMACTNCTSTRFYSFTRNLAEGGPLLAASVFQHLLHLAPT